MPHVTKQQVLFENWLLFKNLPSSTVDQYVSGVMKCSEYLRTKLDIPFDFYKNKNYMSVRKYAEFLFRDIEINMSLKAAELNYIKTSLKYYCAFVKECSGRYNDGQRPNEKRITESPGVKLLQAIKAHDVKALDSAISEGADVNFRGAEQKTLLHYTAGNEKYISVLKRLILKRANLDAVDAYGNTPLHYAVLAKNVAATHMLLRAGAKPYIANNKGETVLDYDGGNDELLKNIVKAGSILHYVLKTAGNKDIAKHVQFLIESGVDVNLKNSDGCTPLHYAANLALPILTLLLESGADINAVDNEGKTALMYAFSAINCRSAMKLLKAGALLKEGTGKGKNGSYAFYPLHEAVDLRNKELISALLKNGSDINLKDEYGRAPIHFIDGWGCIDDEIISFMYDAGADVNACIDDCFQTPLHIIAEKGSDKAINALLKAGANVNACDIEGATPLHEASKNKNGMVVKLLLQAGADINARDKHGNTPLHYASEALNEENVSLLLMFGASEDAINADKKNTSASKE